MSAITKFSQGWRQKAAVFFVCAGLFVFLGLRYWLAATNKPFNDDETTGLYSAYFSTYYNILVVSIGGASTSPLFYLIDRWIFDLLGNDLHRHWDLRFITRFVHSSYWALASVYLFAWVTTRFQRWFGLPFWQALGIGLGLAFFYHANSFLHIYAIEARGYSIWVSFSTIQLLLTMDLFRDDSDNKSWWQFGIVSLLMCLATYTGYAQVGILLGLLLASRWVPISSLRIPSQSSAQALIWKSLVILISAGIVSFFYLTKAPMMPYDVQFYFTMERYFDAIFEVLAKCFHHSSDKGLIFTLPFLFLGTGWYFRRRPEIFWLLIKCLAMLALTVVYFYGSKMKGGLWASRYVISLVPAFSFLYFAGLLMVSFAFANFVRKKFGKSLSPFLLLLVWSLLEITTRSISYQKMFRADWPRLKERNVYGLTTNPNCPPTLESPDWLAVAVEKVNDTCRGIAP
jgi:hypothetical protein